MDIAHLCRRELVGIDSRASLQEAAALMRSQHVGALAVTAATDTRRVVGIVTDRDFAVEVIALGIDPASLRVGDLPHDSEIVQLPGTTGLGECADAMRTAGVRRVLVVDADGGVLGLVSADDLVQAIAIELGTVAEALTSEISREAVELGSAPTRPRLTVAMH